MEGAIVLIIILTGLGIAAYVAYERYQREQREREEYQRALAERKRVEACGEVVLFFANHCGYTARQAISRDELERLIDQGITPEDLAQEIANRISWTEGLVVGYQPFGAVQFDVKLIQEYRDRHIYIVGKSGSGKTNLLRNLILQDMEAGNGIGVIAPEQEMLTEEILPYIPDWRIDDVIYFNPADTDCPVTYNPLHVDEGEDLDLRVDENLTIFRRVMGEGSSGPRMDEILRQVLYTLMARPGSTLLDVEPLLSRTDPSFREEIIRTSEDEAAVHFWREVYPTFPKDAHLPITNRLGRLIRPRLIRNILCHSQSSINFREAMDQGKILLFNLSDGILGEANSQLLGQLIVSKFQMATMSRANLAKTERRPFYLYIDEFQTFCETATTSYEKILSRARKYKLSLILAHQQTGQIPAELLREILGNVSTTVSFAVSREDAARLSKEFITPINGEIVNIPIEEILSLKVGQAYCKIGQHSFFLQTYLADQQPDQERAQAVIERSRQNYGVRVVDRESDSEQIVVEGERLTAKRQLLKTEADLDDLDPSKVF